MSKTTTTTPTAAELRTARLGTCRTTADKTAEQELGTADNCEVTAESTLSTTHKVGTVTRKTSVKATVALAVSDSTDDTAATK